eukprot:g65045.t1
MISVHSFLADDRSRSILCHKIADFRLPSSPSTSSSSSSPSSSLFPPPSIRNPCLGPSHVAIVAPNIGKTEQDKNQAVGPAF